jgi:hypothetical protein
MDFKKTLLIAFLFIGINSFAQKRLEFNQVITIDTTITTSSNSITTNTVIVPIDKTWKIEYFFGDHLQVNGISLGYMTESSYNYGAAARFTSNAIWVKEGDQIRFQTGGCGNGCGTRSYFLSAIEFNIVTD